MKSDVDKTTRLVLGTAQLGMDYGIANRTGQPDIQTVRDIVRTAWEGGIHYFDTAQAYGESERILGEVLSDLGISKQAQVITKLNPNINHSNKNDLADAVRKSLETIKVDRLYGLMLHREDFLDLFETGLADTLKDFIAQGFVENIGISLYSSARAAEALETDIIGILQVPANICDHRFYNAGIFNLAERKGVHIHIRSIFLQGLLLMDNHKLPAKMQYVTPIVVKVAKLCRELNITRQELTLGYIRKKYPHAFVVIGAETQRQIADNIATWNHEKTESLIEKVDEVFASVDERMINPTMWPH